MPELPEVETTKLGITPHLLHSTIADAVIRNHRLRWPIQKHLPHHIKNQTISKINRRGKYIIITTSNGNLIIHLGMSGSLRIANTTSEIRKHDHADFILSNGKILRFHDPRRFGCIIWTQQDPYQHKLLKSLGIEPLCDEFNGDYLFRKSRKRRVAIKNFIMQSQIVTGVGNIYASESLFLSGIRPSKQAQSISAKNYQQLAEFIKLVLGKAIQQGGTTLRDFVNEQGNPGYFAQELNVYNRQNQPCKICSTTIKMKTIGQRSSYYCPSCQK